MFTTDRDLLVLEPRLFLDVSWSAQMLVNAPTGGVISAGGDTLTLSGAGFDSLGIDTGFVAVAGGVPLEVIERIGATMLRISRLRAAVGDPIIPAGAASGLKVVIHTFRPQIALVHAQVLRALGIEPGSMHEAGITNSRAMNLAESLGALHMIFSSAAALVGADSPLWMKARMYAERFRAERGRIVAEIDLDGDGEADTIRRASIVHLVRA